MKDFDVIDGVLAVGFLGSLAAIIFNVPPPASLGTVTTVMWSCGMSLGMKKAPALIGGK